ncbi:hypothetical protein MVEN_00292100 [Mycena venus]|uniref:Uncharacterized protein n=1 Tax=Mycena venus TaxID=2733690 RepID=A0A8H7DEV7_9AGAR|nr:hypothetical protein MVEN_00292100 [Mycena venus]
MSSERSHSPSLGTEDLDMHALLDDQLLGRSATRDWLTHVILTVKTIAAGAEFIPLPYIRAAFGTVVIFLETVDKIKKNRDDLRDLCAGTVEILLLLRGEILTRGHVAGVRFMGLCEDFVSFLRLVQTELENLIRSRTGFRGRFKEFLCTTSVADQINGYRTRINDLRSNFILAAIIDTNVNLASIQKTVSANQETCPIAQQFRRITMGDINLLYETAMSSAVYKVKVFTARVSGESSLMTLAKYEDVERWKSDLELYSRLKHPNVWQLFGISTTSELHALIYYDELIPLPIYRQFYRPSSDLVWVCLEAMLFKQFKDCSYYHHWPTDDKQKGPETTICVKREPVQLCLTMPGLENEYAVEMIERDLSMWHTEMFQHHHAAKDTGTVPNSLSMFQYAVQSSTLARHIDWNHIFAALVPIRFPKPTPWKKRKELFLGSVISDRCTGFLPIAYTPNSSLSQIKKWVLTPMPSVYSHPQVDGTLNRFTFLPGSFKALELPRNRILLSSCIKLEDEIVNLVNTSWLSQANRCIYKTMPDRERRYRCGVVEMLKCIVMVDLEYHHLLRPDGTLREAHIFVCPVSVRHDGLRVGIEFPDSDQVYWSLDPAGSIRMTEEECDSIGLPRLQFIFLPRANFWHEYHYHALHEVFEAKGLDPYSDCVAQLLGLPLAEMDCDIQKPADGPSLNEEMNSCCAT